MVQLIYPYFLTLGVDFSASRTFSCKVVTLGSHCKYVHVHLISGTRDLPVNQSASLCPATNHRMPSKPSTSKGIAEEEEAEVLQAVILADSFNKRFKPLTIDRPKVRPSRKFRLPCLTSLPVSTSHLQCSTIRLDPRGPRTCRCPGDLRHMPFTPRTGESGNSVSQQSGVVPPLTSLPGIPNGLIRRVASKSYP